MVLLAVLRVEARDCFDESSLPLDHRLELLRLFVDIMAVQQPAGEHHDDHRNHDHHRDRQHENPHLIVRTFFQ
ncbi:MAG: hypothetical protein JRH19_27880 [Deltaproteobacteria bacterium]|nr:hypothetical protein [Deltaproteobacteria bacterium]